MSISASPPTPPTAPSGIRLEPDMPVCQQDLPLDWYQEEFKPYAEEYLALPDRLPATVLPWMDGYIHPALDHFGSRLNMRYSIYRSRPPESTSGPAAKS